MGAHHLAGGVDHLDHHLGRRRAQEIVDRDAVGRVLAGGLVGGKGRVGVRIPADPERALRAEEVRLLAEQAVVDLAKRLQVVEDEEAPPMGGEREVVVLDDEVSHRGRRQVEPQEVPALAVVERDVDRPLGAAIEESAPSGILAYHVDDAALGQAAHDL